MMKLIDGGGMTSSTISNRSGTTKPPTSNKFVVIGANGVPQAVPYIPTGLATGSSYLESVNPNSKNI